MKNQTCINQLLTVLLLLCVLFVCMAGTAFAAENVGIAIDLSTLTGTYVISDSGEYTFTGSGSYGIKVESGNPTIVLNNASITVGEGSAIDVASGSNATIFVLGDNTIGTTKTESWDEPCGGIFVAEGGTVNITSNGTNNILRAHGTLAAAIGGKYVYGEENHNAGNINISNVTVYAYTNNFHAAAIGAAGEGTCGTINITNAVVYAYGAGDKWSSAPGIGNAWSLLDWSDTIPIVIISDSEVHTFRYNPYSDYIGYLGDESGDTYATGSINCGDGGSVKNSTIYCYTGLAATTTDKVVKYGALGGLLKEDGTCEGEHSGGTATCTTQAVCENCGASYGELLDHNWENGECTYGCNTQHDPHDWENGICNVCGLVCAPHTGGTATCTTLAVCNTCGESYGEVGGHSPDAAGYTVNGDGTHSYSCSGCGVTVTEPHTYDDEDGTCVCSAVKTYTVSFNPYGDSGAKIVEINGEAKEILHGETFTVPHGQELTVKFENTVSTQEKGVYFIGDVVIDDNPVRCEYDAAANTLTIPGSKVTGDLRIYASAYLRAQFNLHGGALTEDGERQFNRFGGAWDEETATLKIYYNRLLGLEPEYFQLDGHTFAGAMVNGSYEVVDTLEITGDATVDILWNCDGTTLTHVPAKDATCIEAGNIAHYTCTCDKLYAEDKTTVLTSVTLPVDPDNHVGMDSNTGKCACGEMIAVATVTTGGETTYYQTLQEAMAAADGHTATVKLLADCSFDTVIDLYDGSNVTLNLNGKTVNASGMLSIYGGATLTIEGEGNYTSMKDWVDVIYVDGTLNISGGTFSAVGDYAVLLQVWDDGQVNISGGSFTAEGNQSIPVCISGNVTVSGAAAFFGPTERGEFAITSSGTLDLSGVTGSMDGWCVWNNYAIDGVVIGQTLKLPDDYNLKLGEEFVTSLADNQTGTIVEHKTHNYTTEDYDATHHWTACACGATTEKVNHTFTYTPVTGKEVHIVGCSGCTASEEIPHEFTDGVCVCTAKAVARVDDTFYVSIHNALRAAEEINGCTLTLLEDITLTSMSSTAAYTNKGAFTLDLNGKTLSSNKGTLSVSGSANLIIKDSAGGGKIISTGSNAIYQTGGKVTIESGTFEGTLDGVFLSGDSTLNVKGGAFVGSRAMITGFGSDCVIDLTAIDPAGFTLKNNGSGTFAPRLPSGYAMVNGSGTVVTSLSAEESATVKVSLENATVTLSENSFVYDGQPHMPTVTVTLDGRNLTEGTDYQVLYMMAMTMTNDKPTKWFGDPTTSVTCVKADKGYYAVIVGMGNYYTADVYTLNKNFVIEPRPLTIKADDQTIPVGGSVDTANFTITEGALVEGHTLTAEVQVADGTLTTPGTYTDVLFLDTDSVSIMAGEESVKSNYSITLDTGTLTIVEHIHEWTYTADDEKDTITANCVSTIGACPDAEKTFTLNAPGAVYSGNPVEAEVTRDGEDLTYTLRYTGTDYASADAPTNAGSYTVTMTVGDKSIGKEFTISPKDITNCSVSLTQSSFVYSGKAPELAVTAVDNGVGSTALTEGADYKVGTDVAINAGVYKLTVTGTGNYTGSVELDYSITAKPITITSVGVDDVAYDPAGYTLTVKEVVFDGIVEGDTLVMGENGDFTATAVLSGNNAVSDAATATVTIALTNTNYSLSETTAEATFKINKVAAVLNTPLTAADLTYSSTEQALVVGGTATGGDVVYALEEDGTYTSTIPVGENAGTYMVWYYVQGDENHSDTEKASVVVTIKQKEVTPAISGTVTKVYDGALTVPDGLSISLTGVIDGDTVTATAVYSYSAADVGTTTINASNIMLSGDHSANYVLNAETLSAEVGEITKADASITTAPAVITDLVYTGEDQSLISEGVAVGGELQYSLDNATWSTSIPSGKAAGSYTVYYKVVGDNNHNDIAAATLTVTIGKATLDADDFTFTAPTNLIYDGEAKTAIVEAKEGIVGIGEITVTYSPADPTNVGSYKVLINVTEGDNYTAISALEVGSFIITSSDTDMEADADKDEYTYGDIITINGNVKPNGEASQTYALRAAVNTVELYNGDTLLATANVAADGTFTLTYDTKGKAITPAGADIDLLVEYGGSGNMVEKATTVTIKLNPAALTATTATATTRTYEPGNTTVIITEVKVSGVIGTDDVKVDATNLTGEIASADAGTYTSVTLTDLTLSGRDKAFYTITDATVTTDVEITPKEITNPTIVLDASSFVYDGTEKKPSVTSVKDGDDLIDATEYTVSYANNIEMGTATVTLTDVAGGNYTVSGSTTFQITQSGTEMTATADKASYTYGETITVTGTVKATGTAPAATLTLRSAPAAQQVALFAADGTQLTDPVNVVNGAYTLTYNTTNKGILPGASITLTVKFVGDDNMADQSAAVTVALTAKSVEPVLSGSASKEYDGTDTVTDASNLTINLNGIIAGDTVSAVAAGYAYADGTVGQSKSITANGITLSGEDNIFYTLAQTEASAQIGEIKKAMLISVTEPADTTLDVYCADADTVIGKLPDTVIYHLSDGKTVELKVEWSCTAYDSTPGATNAFAWAVSDSDKLACYEIAQNVADDGTVIVTNSAFLPVTVTGTDAAIIYNGTTYDVTQMFAIDSNAGAAVFEIISGGTGEGALNGSVLTITKAGTITIKVTTAPNAAYAAGEATAILTISKGTPAVTAPTGLTAWYGQKLSDIALPTVDGGAWSWTDMNSSVGDSGVQIHQAIFTPTDINLWNITTHPVNITVAQAGTSFGEMKVYNGDTESTTFTYGETITVKAEATAVQPAAFSLRSLLAPAKHQMALFIRNADGSEIQISEAVNEQNGVYTMTYNTTGKALSIGDNALIAKFVGDENMADYQETVLVTLNPKELTIASLTAQDRFYEPGNQQVTITGTEVSGKADANDDVSVLIDGMTATINSENVGTYDTAHIPQNVSLTGNHAGYYFATGNVSVSIPQGVEITQATPYTTSGAPAQPVFDPIYQDGMTLGDIPVSLPAGTFNVPGTIEWEAPGDTPVTEGTPFTWVFTPDDPNWKPVTGTVVIYPDGEPPVITAPAGDQEVTVYEGEQGTMAITAEDAASYQWYINRYDGLGFVPISGATSASYTTSVVNLGNNGFTYYCVASNAYGETESPVFLLQVLEKIEVPETGDQSNITLWAALTLLSVAGLATIVATERKRKTN